MMLLASTLLVSACSPAGGTPAATDTTAVTEAPEPIDLNDLAEVLFIDEAEHFKIERAIYDCMTEAGFEYNIGWYFPHDLFEDAPWRVVANPPPEVDYDPEAVDEFRRAGDALALSQVGWQDTFFGTEREHIDLGSGGGLERPVGGCLDQGQATVVGDSSAWAELFDRIQVLRAQVVFDEETDIAALLVSEGASLDRLRAVIQPEAALVAGSLHECRYNLDQYTEWTTYCDASEHQILTVTSSQAGGGSADTLNGLVPNGTEPGVLDDGTPAYCLSESAELDNEATGEVHTGVFDRRTSLWWYNADGSQTRLTSQLLRGIHEPLDCDALLAFATTEPPLGR